MSAVKLKRYLLIVLAVLVSFLATLVIGLAILLHAPGSAQWLISFLDEATPYDISVDSVEGKLAGPLSIQQLKLTDGDMNLEVGEIRFDWRPAALLKGDLHVIELSLRDVDMVLPAEESPAQETEKAPFGGVTLPLNLQVDRLQIDDVSLLNPANPDPVVIESLAFSAHSQAEQLMIDQLELAAFSSRLKVTGSLVLSAGLPMDLTVDWLHHLPEGPELAGRGGIKGDLEKLQVVQQMDAPLSSGLEASLFDLESKPRWEAKLTLTESELGQLMKDFPLRVNGILESRGTPEDIDVSADLQLRQPDYGEASLTLRGDYRQDKFIAETLRLTTPTGAKIEGRGEYQLDASMGHFSSQLTWQDLRWPLQGETVQIQSRQGALNVTGTPQDYQYTLTLDALSPGQPSTQLEASGQGDLKGLKLEKLLATFEEGKLAGTGDLGWQPSLQWQLQLEGDGINPALWQRDFPGQLSLLLATKGQVTEAGLQAEVNLERLQGQLRDYPVNANALASVEGDKLSVESLQILSGKNRIALNGTIEESLALDWQVDAPALESFWPGLEGRLAGSGRLSGPRDTPRIEAKLEGEQLGFKDNRIKGLKLDADVSFSGEQDVKLSLLADELSAGSTAWSRLDLVLGGTIPKHKLDLSLKGKAVPQTTINIAAGWTDASEWAGSLQHLTLALPDSGEWVLKDPAGFSLAADSQQMDRFCLESQGANLCGAYSGSQDKGWEGQASLREFPLVVLQPWLPNGLQISGKVELETKLKSSAGGQPLGELNIKLPAGRVGLDLSSDKESVSFADGWLSATLDKQGASAQMKLPLKGLGAIEGEGELPSINLSADDWNQQSVAARLMVDLDDLSIISLFSSQLQNVRGRIKGDVSLDGTLGKPKVVGGADLIEAALDIPELGLELREIAVQVQSQSQTQLGLTGSVRSGQGVLQLKGSLGLDGEAGFPVRLELRGSDLTVANIPQAEVLVTPNISFERDGSQARLKGEIQIPFARIRPRKLPTSAVSSSPDLVVVSVDTPEQDTLDSHLSTELRIVFGDRVSFDGFGLRGNLTGRLLVIDEPKRPVIGRGRVGIRDGTYRAYGQDLTIERGFALFVDSPVDNPGLDVRAVREVDDVTAGIRVGGTLKSPKIDLFSTPAMSESDALTYLVTGRPPGEGGGESVGLAAALSASGAGSAAEEVARQLGLDELRVDAGSGLEEASVVAGTYLSPRLYLQYINELASRETKLRMRYDINKRLQLEAETGKSQASDLFYTFDR